MKNHCSKCKRKPSPLIRTTYRLSSFILVIFLGFTPPEIKCADPLGIENGKIPNSAMTASSEYNQYSEAERGRLNEMIDGSYYGGWSPKTSSANIGQWLQIDLGKNVKVTRIATQGRYNVGWWTKTYTLSYRIQGGSTFEQYNNGQVSFSKVLQENANINKIKVLDDQPLQDCRSDAFRFLWVDSLLNAGSIQAMIMELGG